MPPAAALLDAGHVASASSSPESLDGADPGTYASSMRAGRQGMVTRRRRFDYGGLAPKSIWDDRKEIRIATTN